MSHCCYLRSVNTTAFPKSINDIAKANKSINTGVQTACPPIFATTQLAFKISTTVWYEWNRITITKVLLKESTKTKTLIVANTQTSLKSLKQF